MTDFNRPPNNHGFYGNQPSNFHDNQPHGYDDNHPMGGYFGGQRQVAERFAGPQQKFMGTMDEPDNGTSHWMNSRFNGQGSMQFPGNMGSNGG